MLTLLILGDGCSFVLFFSFENLLLVFLLGSAQQLGSNSQVGLASYKRGYLAPLSLLLSYFLILFAFSLSDPFSPLLYSPSLSLSFCLYSLLNSPSHALNNLYSIP